jgi:hypothetical protein
MTATEPATMATFSATTPDEHNDLLAETMIDDDATVLAETPSTKTDFFEEEMMDLTIRYEIPYRNGKSHGDDFKLHVQLLEAMTTIFDKNSLRIYNNKNERVKTLSARKWLNKEYYMDHFNIHDTPSQRKTVIIHRIMSRKSISDIKHEPTVIQLLKKSSTYLRAHFWKEDEVSLKDIGFLVNYAPTKHSKEFVAKDIFERCHETPNIEWSNAPPFQLIHAQPRIKLVGSKNPVKTHAFSVQVLTKNASMMNKFLQKIYEDDHSYVPYSMKKQFPKAVATAIFQQNKLLKNTWVIVIVGISREVMIYLENSIQESSNVIDISDTNRTDKSGKWNVLVQETSFKSVRKRLAANIQQWVLDLPPDVQATIPDNFPPPKVHQKNAYNDDDEDSSYGQASYMSSCAQSYASFDDNEDDEQYYNPPGATNHTTQGLSYASALSGYQPPPNISPLEVLVPGKLTPKENQAILASIRAEEKIANLEAEIQSLKTLLIGATTPSTVTENSTPDIISTNDRMSTLETSMETMSKQFSTWMSEMRNNDYGSASQHQNHRPTPDSMQVSVTSQSNQKTDRPLETTPSSHQSKRTDTRPTPERPDRHTDVNEMQIELFPETEGTPATTSTQLTTQPPFPTTPPRDTDQSFPLSESPSSSTASNVYASSREEPHEPMSSRKQMILNATHTHLPDHPYDRHRRQFTYQRDGDGTLFCSGLARPSDFVNGVIQGPRPMNPQHAHCLLMHPGSPPELPYTPPGHGLFTQPEPSTQPEPLTSIIAQYQGQPSPERKTPTTVTGSLSESLPAEGAQIEHA